MVCNFSIDHDKAPQTSKLIRATLHAGMVCQTLVEQPVEKGRESNLKRNEVTCKMTYAVNGKMTFKVLVARQQMEPPPFL